MGHLFFSQKRLRKTGMLLGCRVCLMARCTVYANPVDSPTQEATHIPPQSVIDKVVSHIPLNTVVEKAPKAIQTCENDIQRATMLRSSSTHGREAGFGGRDVDGLQWNAERNAVLLCFQSRPPPIF